MSDVEEDDCEELPEGLVQRRAAFDIGSGATKLMIADVDVETGQLGDIVHASERTVKYPYDGVLSDAVQAEGIKVLHALRTAVLASGCTAYTAVATEVFRKAPNGAAFLQRVRAELGLEIALVSQEEEAQIGFRTAVAVGQRGRAATLAWDSGGGSFQLSREVAAGEAGAPPGLRTYVGALGASVATAAMIEHVQKRRLASPTASPNPASREEAQLLVAHCRAQLETPPPWLRGAALATAIGGANSIFRCVEQVTHDLDPAAAAAAVAAGAPPGRFGVAAVRAALEACCGLTDAALAEKGHVEAPMVVPKLCLLLAVLEACGLQEFECAGLWPQALTPTPAWTLSTSGFG